MITPGKWGYESGEPPGGEMPHVYAEAEDGSRVVVAYLSDGDRGDGNGPHWEEIDENGRLLAASKELIEAAEQLLWQVALGPFTVSTRRNGKTALGKAVADLSAAVQQVREAAAMDVASDTVTDTVTRVTPGVAQG